MPAGPAPMIATLVRNTSSRWYLKVLPVERIGRSHAVPIFNDDYML
jgi:hypothetical protein